ncbi:TetR family transcriptional regulator [Gordonia sp. X0973]|uniref:TetR/AcrR family transcriptional regulator n=1 Tax=Gordonia sp. X0973 TaxID=2742602 RepID=UPI000F52FCD7|nr:TetR family transcriptional regulator [Gordonia sp. X0973]QKT06157.1 TetR family transcriptional regulator [Gordonia sp. X0973]
MANAVRDQILAVTLDLIGEKGIGGVSNRAIAKAAGVSLGTLTYHFESQEDLLSEALNLFVDDEVARLTAIKERLATTSPLDVEATFEQARIEVEDRANRNGQIAQLELYLHASRAEGLKDAARRCFAAYDQVATSLLEGADLPGSTRYAPLFVALVDGLELRRLAVDAPAIDLSEALDIVRAGIESRSAASEG